MRRELIASIAFFLAASPLAYAHPGHGMDGFMHGFNHPFSGTDHLITALAVGVWGASIGGRARFVFPLTFVIAMYAGAFAGFSGSVFPMKESGILLSIMLMGLALFFSIRLPISLAAPVLAVFASFHGNAHSVEMIDGLSAAKYGLGFSLATASLHIMGIVGVLFMQKLLSARAVQFAVRVLGTITLAFAGFISFGIL